MGFWPRVDFGYAIGTSPIMKGDDFMDEKFIKHLTKTMAIMRANPQQTLECIEAVCKETAATLNERIEANKDLIAEVERRTMERSSEVFD